MSAPRPIALALIGAGARGELNLATLVKKHGDLMKFVAVAEMDDERRADFVRRFAIPKENAFRDWRELFAKPKLADAWSTRALPLHYESTLAGCAWLSHLP
jgi:predicted dehydrogenase